MSFERVDKIPPVNTKGRGRPGGSKHDPLFAALAEDPTAIFKVSEHPTSSSANGAAGYLKRSALTRGLNVAATVRTVDGVSTVYVRMAETS